MILSYAIFKFNLLRMTHKETFIDLAPAQTLQHPHLPPDPIFLLQTFNT